MKIRLGKVGSDSLVARLPGKLVESNKKLKWIASFFSLFHSIPFCKNCDKCRQCTLLWVIFQKSPDKPLSWGGHEYEIERR